MLAAPPPPVLLRAHEICSSPSELWENPAAHPHYKAATVQKYLKLQDDLHSAYIQDTAVNTQQLRKNQFRQAGNYKSIESLCNEGQVNKEIQLSDQPGTPVSPAVLNRLVQICIDVNDLTTGRLVHGLIERLGYMSDAFIGSSVIRMYASSGRLHEANEAFSKLVNPNVFLWSAIISANAKNGQDEEAIQLYHQMQKACVDPDGHVFVAVLQACANVPSLVQGKLTHVHIVEWGFTADVKVANTLIAMYSKCGCLDDALMVFNNMLTRDVVTWSAMIEGCAELQHSQEAFCLFEHMLKDGPDPNSVTFLNILKAYDSSILVDHGMLVHAEIIKRGFESDVTIGSALIVMYAKHGNLGDTLRVFERLPNRNVVTWNAMIVGCAQSWCIEVVLQLFENMQSDGLEPTRVTFICLIKACSSQAALEQGKVIHCHIVKSGLESELTVGNALIDMYGKCERLLEAQSVFDKLPDRDVITWGAMMNTYAQQGHCQEPLQLFHGMLQAGVEPNQGTFVSILKACSSIAALDQGKLIHASIIESGLVLDAFIGNTLIAMYAKCGSLMDAQRVFGKLSKPDVVAWNAMIAGYALHSNYEAAFKHFLTMQKAGCRPDSVTFVCLLSACSHVNLVDEGWHHYNVMTEEYGISPTVEHLVCMVDLLGRAGRLREAEALLKNTPFQSNIVGWKSLLFNCRKKGDVELGERCFCHVTSLDSKDPASYVLMSNIYANAGMWENAGRVEELKKQARVWKKPGKAFIEIGNKVHDFVVGDRSHPQSDAIYAKLKSLSAQMEKDDCASRPGLVPLTLLSNEGHEDALCGHCERLAIALGLISTPVGTTIRVSKNLRMCSACHNAAKFISKVEKREVIIADTYCIHQFEEGSCSCKDI